MKKWIIMVWLAGYFMPLRAQFEPLMYDLHDNPSSVFSYPSRKAGGRFYVLTPLIPHIQLQYKLSGPTPYDLLAADGRDFNLKWQETLNAITRNQGLLWETKFHLLAFGINKEDKTYRGGFYAQGQTWVFHAPSLYRFALYGNSDASSRIDLSELHFNAEFVYTLYFGMSMPLGDGDSRWGFNVKLYNSAGTVSSTSNKGEIYYVPGQNNYYTHVFDNIDLEIRSSGLRKLMFEDNMGNKNVDSAAVVHDFMRRFGGTGNWGLGLDIGLEKPLSDAWTWSVNVEDLGIIRYADDNFSLRAHGHYRYEGVQVQFPDQPVDYWREIRDDFKQKIPTDTLTGVFYQWRPFKVYTSFRYTFGTAGGYNEYDCYYPWKSYAGEDEKPHSYMGWIGFYQNLAGRPYWGTGLYVHWIWARGFYTRLTLTTDSYTPFNAGLGLGGHIGPWHIYLMADNLTGYLNAAASHGQYVALGTYWSF